MPPSPIRLTALLTAAALVPAACGGANRPSGPSAPAGGSVNTTAPEPVTHADPAALLPRATEISGLLRPTVTPSRHDQTLSPSTLSSAFASVVARADRLAAGTAELDVAGTGGRSLYAHVFVFRSLHGASSLTPAFLRSTRLRTASGQPSGAPGDQSQASTQSYGRRQLSYRYAFREGNVLAYVELDGPRSKSAPARASAVAKIIAGHVRSASG